MTEALGNMDRVEEQGPAGQEILPQNEAGSMSPEAERREEVLGFHELMKKQDTRSVRLESNTLSFPAEGRLPLAIAKYTEQGSRGPIDTTDELLTVITAGDIGDMFAVTHRTSISLVNGEKTSSYQVHRYTGGDSFKGTGNIAQILGEDEEVMLGRNHQEGLSDYTSREQARIRFSTNDDVPRIEIEDSSSSNGTIVYRAPKPEDNPNFKTISYIDEG